MRILPKGSRVLITFENPFYEEAEWMITYTEYDVDVDSVIGNKVNETKQFMYITYFNSFACTIKVDKLNLLTLI